MKLPGTALALVALTFSVGAAKAPELPVYPAVTPQETARVIEAFRDAAARSLSDHSGDIFALPAKYTFVTDLEHADPVKSHLHGHELPNQGTVHGVSWEYDTRVPIVLWGPGFIKPGVRTATPATQQDLVPTYAHLMGTVPPADAHGRVLEEALVSSAKRPKVILTVVFDQGGEVYYKAHPGMTPRVDRFKQEGSYFTQSRVTHVDCETGIGHAAIGTGAWPSQTGISSNNIWLRGLGGRRYSFNGEQPASPIFLNSPTLGDVWLRATDNKALLLSYCYADRAAIGMAGHGSLYRGNKKPWVVFYDEKKGELTTNEAYYALPDYLKGVGPKPQYDELTQGTGQWMGHAIDPKSNVRSTPAYATFDGDNMVQLIRREPFGADDVTDLIFVTLKSTDACGHAFGHESDEAGAVLAEQDKQFGRILDALVAKVGRENVVVALTADHGSTPLVELSGGKRLGDRKLIEDLNRQVDKLDNGVSVFEYASATQLFVNQAERVRNKLTYAQLKKVVLGYRVDGKPFFVDALTRPEALERAKRFLAP